MSERGFLSRCWSWLQYVGTARHLSFERPITRHSLVNQVEEARATTLPTSTPPPTPDMPIGEPYVSISPSAAKTKLSPLACKQSFVSPCLSLHGFSSSPHVSDTTLALDPYTYTTGRWLNRDRLERESRYIQFDFAALCKRTVELCPTARRVVRYEKKEGGFNRAFVMIMDDETKIVAKLATRIAGPQGLTTNSEVATMTYCKHESLNKVGRRCITAADYSISMISEIAHHAPGA